MPAPRVACHGSFRIAKLLRDACLRSPQQITIVYVERLTAASADEPLLLDCNAPGSELSLTIVSLAVDWATRSGLPGCAFDVRFTENQTCCRHTAGFSRGSSLRCHCTLPLWRRSRRRTCSRRRDSSPLPRSRSLRWPSCQSAIARPTDLLLDSDWSSFPAVPPQQGAPSCYDCCRRLANPA